MIPDWRPVHPCALAEMPSETLAPFVYKDEMPDGAEYYENDKYQVTRRDFQQIKNRFAGTEWEAVELYPAESRLLDPSNYYMLWCFESLPIGKREGRRIASPEQAISPQRGFGK